MAFVKTSGARIAGIYSCVPKHRVDNLRDSTEFSETEVRKVVGMAGVAARRLAGNTICSSDLCVAAAEQLLARLKWEPDSVDAVIMVTQTPDYFLPSTACVIHGRLGLSDKCATFDVGLGCSGYPYGIWLASMMLQGGGMRRILVLHGETPSRLVDKTDRSVSLLFGDAGSATALEASDSGGDWHFALHTDGAAHRSMIVESGGFRDRFGADPRKHCVVMDGALIFNFTIKRVPALIDETLTGAGLAPADVDYFIFHQSNHYIIRHICSKQGLPEAKVPVILKEYGNTGGASIPLTLTEAPLDRPQDRPLRLLLLGYGVGLSWGSALVDLDSSAELGTIELDGSLNASPVPNQNIQETATKQ